MKVPESNRNIHYILDGNPDRIESLLEDAEEQWKPYYEEDERLALFAARLASLDKSLNHLAFRDTSKSKTKNYNLLAACMLSSFHLLSCTVRKNSRSCVINMLSTHSFKIKSWQGAYAVAYICVLACTALCIGWYAYSLM